MHQHWVPASYLRAWCDPASEHLQDPYVWLFSKDGSNIRRKSPKNLFRESNTYTSVDENGREDQTIEQHLSKLEDAFERLRRDKIMRSETLTDEDKATLCAFVACAHFRTRRSREHWKRQLGRAVELGDRIKARVESLSSEEKALLENLSMPASGPTFSLEDLRQAAEQPLQNLLPTVTEREAEFLFYMRMTIFCTSNHTGFITSDAPVVLVDPELHKMPPFYRNLALGSPTIEVTMPIAPSRLVLFTHNEKLAGGYFPILSTLQLGMDLIDENNRRRRFHCDEHFVSNSSERKGDLV